MHAYEWKIVGWAMKLMVCVFTDNHARYMDDELEPVPAGSVPPLYDIPLSQVNRVLYKDWQKKARICRGHLFFGPFSSPEQPVRLHVMQNSMSGKPAWWLMIINKFCLRFYRFYIALSLSFDSSAAWSSCNKLLTLRVNIVSINNRQAHQPVKSLLWVNKWWLPFGTEICCDIWPRT